MTSSRNADVVGQLIRRRDRTHQILNDQLPTTAERLCGYPPLKGSETADRVAFFTGEITKSAGKDDANVPLLTAAQNASGPDELWELFSALSPFNALCNRVLIYLALEFGDRDAQLSVARVARAIAQKCLADSPVDAVYALAFAALLDTEPRGKDRSVMKIDDHRAQLSDLADTIVTVNELISSGSPGRAASPLTALAQLANKLDAAAKSQTTTVALGGTLVVVPTLGEPTGSSARKEVLGQFKSIAGVALPVAGVEELVEPRRQLLARYPHFAIEIDLILRQRRPYRLLLVGSPGCGKTSLARDLADALDLPSVVYPGGGAADSSFSGTSAQWTTSRPSIPLQTVLRSRTANPVVIIDEIDKADPGRNNGSFADALLTFLEPGSARRVLDPTLEVEVDLSAVSYIATANKIEDVPGPLRDRLRVIRMPDPSPAHATALIATMLDDLAVERGIDHRWLQPLAADELELVNKAWPGGSLRRLRRVVELLIDGRDQQMGRA
jgi:hypothetical protein